MKPILKTITFCVFLVGTVDSFAQNGLFLSGTVESAGMGQPKFEQGGSILHKKWIGTYKYDDTDILFCPELNLDYHFWNHFGVGLNFSLLDKAAVFHDQRFMDTNDIQGVNFKENHGTLRADSGNFNPNRNYFSSGLSFSYFFLTNTEYANGPYLSYGIRLNQIIGHRGHSTMNYLHESTSELLELKLNYHNRYTSEYIEVGYIFYQDYYPMFRDDRPKRTTKNFTLSLALRYTFAGIYMDADYRVTKNGMLQYTDRVILDGNYLSFVMKFGGGIFGRQIDRVNKRIYDNAQLEKEEEKARQKAEVEEIRKRDVAIKEEIVVKSPVIKISVWDHMKYDKDIISLGLDNQMILEDYTLQTSKKTITLNLNQPLSSLILYAISEGTEKPCTVAILIDDGVSQQQVILNSSLTDSEGIHIRVAK